MSTTLAVPSAELAPRWTLEARHWIDHPSGYLALAAANHRFQVAGRPGFIADHRHGRHWIALGGVHAPPAERAALLDAYLAAAATARRRVLVVQLRAEQVPLFRGRGFAVRRLGTSFTLTLSRFHLGGGAKEKLRNKLRRAERLGLHAAEVGRELPRDRATFAALAGISEQWLAAKREHELRFLVGVLGTPAEAERRVFVTLDSEDQPVAFISYVPAWGARPGLLHDLTRRLPDAPAGAMELCNHFALTRFAAEGVAHLHFGLTPFDGGDCPPPGGGGAVPWCVRLLLAHGDRLYPVASQAAYKRKWEPDLEEPEYVAGRPLSLRAGWDLLRATGVL